MSGKGKGKKGAKAQEEATPAAAEPVVVEPVVAATTEAPADEKKGKKKGEKTASPKASPKTAAKTESAAAPVPVPAVSAPAVNAPAAEKKTYNNDPLEQTFIAIKPDGVQRGLVGEIISRFEKRGFKLVALKMIWPTKEKAAGHYDDLKAKKFFAGLVDYFSSGPIVAMVWQGKNVVGTGRNMLGETNPLASAPGTIRGDYSLDIGRNVIHGSDAVESANREIAFWFNKDELSNWNPTSEKWVYE